MRKPRGATQGTSVVSVCDPGENRRASCWAGVGQTLTVAGRMKRGKLPKCARIDMNVSCDAWTARNYESCDEGGAWADVEEVGDGKVKRRSEVERGVRKSNASRLACLLRCCISR